jgi:hypothetical protein
MLIYFLIYAANYTPYALRLTPYALRLTPYALRLTPYAYLIEANSVFTVVFSTKEAFEGLLLFTI